MHPPDYPLRFNPIYKERLWGGGLHRTFLQAPAPAGLKIGESWEISDRPQDQTTVANGPWAGTPMRALIEAHPEAILGPGGKPDQPFPLLVKFLGTSDKLSLQVHPGDVYAQQKGLGDAGKTEMWYILESRPDARVLVGFKKPQTPPEIKCALLENKFEPLMNARSVMPDDAFFIPAGRVHGIGAGILLAEIQENSDATYRVYDYGRKDETGKPRALHVEQALEVMELGDTSDGWLPRSGSKTRALVQDPHFCCEHVFYSAASEGAVCPGFQIAVITRGEGRLQFAGGVESLKRGTVLLLPANFQAWRILPTGQDLGILWAWDGQNSPHRSPR